MKKNNVKVSVIMPIYNGAKYLSQAIESILHQTLREIELILVDDGSQDDSLQIALSYSRKYPNILVIPQENKGVSAARNRGIERARGKYIGFVDSDDWIHEEMYESLYSAAQEKHLECVSCNFIAVNQLSKNQEKFEYPYAEYSYIEKDKLNQTILLDLLRSNRFASPCNKIYLASVVRQNNIHFPTGVRLAEDNVFNMRYFNCISSFQHIDEVLYFYRIDQYSATNNIKKLDFADYIEVYSLKNDISSSWNFISKEEKEGSLAQWLVHNGLLCLSRYLYYGGLNGLLKSIKLFYHPLLKKHVKKIKSSPYELDRFMNYMFSSLKKRNYLKCMIGVYYLKRVSPLLNKMRRRKHEKDIICH